MKLRNKKTGEIGQLHCDDENEGCLVWAGDKVSPYHSISELNEEWEDYEEPKWNWYIDWNGEIKQCDNRVGALLKFETEEEAEKAVEKLKAWKRLKDKGFKFKWWVRTTDNFGDTIEITATSPTMTCSEDLDLLFGGEE